MTKLLNVTTNHKGSTVVEVPFGNSVFDLELNVQELTHLTNQLQEALCKSREQELYGIPKPLAGYEIVPAISEYIGHERVWGFDKVYFFAVPPAKDKYRYLQLRSHDVQPWYIGCSDLYVKQFADKLFFDTSNWVWIQAEDFLREHQKHG